MEKTILDTLFSIIMTWTVIAIGFEIINGKFISAAKDLAKGVLSAAFLIAILGHFLFGFSVGDLFKYYVVGGYKILPQLVAQFITPIFQAGGGK